MLIGRERELRPVATLLEEARRGRSGTLVLVGEAGVGKTALLGEARRLAPDMRLLAATGVESESELPFAGLHELLRPLLELLPRLAASQSRALRAALALEEGQPDTLAVGAGTLSLLVEAAEEAPVLIVLDDAHWLDRASAEALAFAARRLAGEELAVLAALRPGIATPFEAFPRLELGPLATEDARRLLALRNELVPVADESRVLAAAAGNPLVLLELPLDLARDLPAATPPEERLRRAFTQRVESLPAPARLGLLLAAAEPDPGPVRRAAAALGLGDPLRPAEAAGLVRLGPGELAFRHPVLRSLVYADASPGDRRAAHRALAEALAGETDRDRRAWHVAAAVEDVDEAAAALLEQTAKRAAARGGHAAEARALERAARLSPHRADLARRLYAASIAWHRAGDATRGLALTEEALPVADDPLVHADLLALAGETRRRQGADVPERVYLQELEVEGLDELRTARLLAQIVDARLYSFDAAGALALAPRLEAAARGIADRWGRVTSLGSAGSAYLLAGDRDRATRLFREIASDPEIPATFPWDYLWLEWYDELRASLVETLLTGRATGNQLFVAFNQSGAAHLELRCGRLGSASASAAEAIPLADAIGTPALVGIASGALAFVHAWRGRAEACTALAGAALGAASKTGDRYHQAVARQAIALLALGAGRPEDAIAELEPLARGWAASTVVEPGVVPFVPDLVEAYATAGDRTRAAEWLDRFALIATGAERTWALAACARCEGLLASAEAFEAPFRRALELLEPSPLGLELARTRLAYGERLRRQGRRRDARAQLRAAHLAFAAEGAAPWQARAAGELRATGEQVADEARPLPDLTPQELHIARLVAEGKTNKEIAAAIFLSPKTIEYHLANTFRKLDIHSRAELARLVARDMPVDGVL